ncbi:dimethylaniline monooxygenase 2 [Colletotrichum tofieldiae]|nr:dimethylaniline monooxygenase 2 [Colletotrichum tofieldiae]GKT93354.1 dimethylaniline monooxygenase 2 [Colletotrichum tofieldiae]
MINLDADPVRVGGLSAPKELHEVNFDVTVFQRRSDVGGFWTFFDDSQRHFYDAVKVHIS